MSAVVAIKNSYKLKNPKSQSGGKDKGGIGPGKGGNLMILLSENSN